MRKQSKGSPFIQSNSGLSNNDDISMQNVDTKPQRNSLIPDFQLPFVWPLILVSIWLGIFIFEIATNSLPHNGLSHYPVVMGDVSKISILKPMNEWVTILVGKNSFFGFFMFLFYRLVMLLVMVICTVTTAYFHVSWWHVLSNAGLFLIVSACLTHFHIGGRQIVFTWSVLSVSGISSVWLLAESLSFAANFIPNPQGWLKIAAEISHSNIPVVGASVGIYGMYSFILAQMIRQLNFKISSQFIFIIAAVILIALLYSVWSTFEAANLYTQFGSSIILASCMHLMGIFYGMLRGFRKNYREDVQR